MSDAPNRLPLILGLLASLAVVGGGLAFALWPEPEPEPEEDATAEDTGMSRNETEAQMRTIGYVQ